MSIFDDKFDFLKQTTSDNNPDWISDDCIMDWPFFSWKGKEDIQKALLQLNNHCSAIELIFSGTNKEANNCTCLYKLAQAQKSTLWCGIWLNINQDEVKNIKFIFDSFEYFNDNETVNIFGYKKVLTNTQNETDVPDGIQNNYDNETTIIIDLIQKFFLKKYGIPLQNTSIAKNRLYETAQNVKNKLRSNDQYTIILPFFSANEIGPIQFCATIFKTSGSYEIA
ncbi:MAG: hypothetical protein ACD_29C00035G0002 [uncultured bacterium]|nr:MAG: hypothetical protein ACD_29C00035G0002 [uncultured bacterium]